VNFRLPMSRFVITDVNLRLPMARFGITGVNLRLQCQDLVLLV
jgi:hypothetical protein